ncbi:hypothetical protein [Candidatus Babela massiliensis]|uniref:Uncharacterized protein n=1 Tax=Candidatus Babela massiliensis TaxID=673862 RepID=V6DHS2_9BACT|nr:hypothetical protein [Candidatus Babela massiliensis]CDK30483.1 hypothetical protein BABL1_gene_535 [Candidatus Babela massiliensis]
MEEVLSIKPELVQFKDYFLGFIEECKSDTLNLEVKRIEAVLENIFQDND